MVSKIRPNILRECVKIGVMLFANVVRILAIFFPSSCRSVVVAVGDVDIILLLGSFHYLRKNGCE